jgi:hypothetical protein
MEESSLVAALMNDTVKLLSCEWLLEQYSPFVLQRRQDLPSDAFLSAARAAKLIQKPFELVVVSYGWLTMAHPDPHGQQTTLIVNFLREQGHFVGVFIDFCSVPQKDLQTLDRTPEDTAVFMRALGVMTELVLQNRLEHRPTQMQSDVRVCAAVCSREHIGAVLYYHPHATARVRVRV